MRIYGGSFAKSLGNALLVADRENTQKIKETWPKLWKQYLDAGKRAKAKGL